MTGTADAPNPYKPGDRLRVVVPQPYGTELAPGDLVTVEKTGTKIEPNGREIHVVVVSTSYGNRILGLDVVEPFEPPTYIPAEPDEIIDAQLRALVTADPDLVRLFSDAEVTLGAEDDDLSEALGGGTATMTCEHTTSTGWTDPGHDDVVTITDYAGDKARFVYAEKVNEDGERQGAFFISTTDEDGEYGTPVLLLADQVEPLIRYLFGRKKHSERDE